MITNFLKTKRSLSELKVALEVLHEFKECESMEEFIMLPLSGWAKLEQLEEFLAYLTENIPLADDTIAYMERR
jgi:hypothetical protein